MEDDGAGAAVVAGDPLHHLQTGEAGHGDVEEHEVGLELRDQPQRFVTVAGLAHHLDAGHLLQHRAHARADQGVIVGEKDADQGKPPTAPAGSASEPS
jgi:hypothetical protein